MIYTQKTIQEDGTHAKNAFAEDSRQNAGNKPGECAASSCRVNRMSREGLSDLPMVEHGLHDVVLAGDHERAVENPTSLNVTKESRLLGGFQTEAFHEQDGHPSEEGRHIESISVAHDVLVEGLRLQREQEQGDTRMKGEQQSGWDDENSQQNSWNSTVENEANGWDQDWPTETASSPENIASGSSSGWGLQPGDTEPVPFVDLGYFDQEIIILGSSLVVRVAYTAKGVEDWIQQYSPRERLFGVDIEWRPNQFKGQDNKAALFQIAGKHGCLIVQLLYIDRIPDALRELLADRNAELAGVGVRADTKKLFQDYGLQCRGEVDLGLLAADVFNRRELKRAGLATLSDLVLGIPFKKVKSVCLSNWAAEGLSLSQITYAASDACIAYFVLVSLNAKSKERPRDRPPSSSSPRVISENSSPRTKDEVSVSRTRWDF